MKLLNFRGLICLLGVNGSGKSYKSIITKIKHMNLISRKVYTLLISVYIVMSGCTAPRTITTSGKVTPKGNFSVGFNSAGNIPTQTMSILKDIVKDKVNQIAQNDSIKIDGSFQQINKAAMAYALDPTSVGTEFSIRYGVFKRVDVGYKRSSGLNVYDAKYQFLGSTGYVDDATDQKFYGSVGLQYSSQSQELPSILSEIQSRLGYTFKRSDILVPLIFSYSFGNEEKYGCVSFGLAYNYSRIHYAAVPVDIYTPQNIKIMGIEKNQSYSALGVFVNSKVGYKYVYLVGSLSFYTQNYGDYTLLDGSVHNLKGVTVIPTIGLQVRLGRSKAKS
jgi:hypothetical protein